MNLLDLLLKWELLGTNDTRYVKTIRLDPASKPDLYLGLKENQERCLVLKLPDNFEADFQSSVKQNLSLELFRETRWVILTLLDDQFNDLFDDLLFSIFHKISEISEASLYVSEFLNTFYKWSEFFQENQTRGLSDDEVRGLLGEMLVLQEKLLDIPSGQVNDVLHSWTGPYDTGQDFTGQFSNSEVKTRLNTSATVKISGEYQLQPDPGKNLELIIITIRPDHAGISLTSATLGIRDFVVKAMGDYTLFLKAIGRKGLTIHSMVNYDHLLFKPVNMVTYQASADDFPRLDRAGLHPAITGVSYKLTVQVLSPWIIIEKNY